jgi:DedD protein
MNDGFKQRLVGAVVLGSMVLIIWPIVFTQTSGPLMDKRSQIPPRPSFEKYTVPQPTRPSGVEPISDAAETINAKPIKEIKKPAVVKNKPTPTPKPKPQQRTEKPQLDNKGLPVSWVLQVASFSQHSNAVELKRSLQKKGYKAYTQHIKQKGKESVRVYVGPKLTKVAFANDKKTIDKAFKVKSLIVRFVQ